MDPAMRDAARRQPPLRRERPIAAMLAAALVLSCLLGDPSPTVAARPNAQAAAEFLARDHGGRASDFAVVYQRPARLSTGETVWATKLVDRRTGAVSLVYRDLAGVMGGPGLVRGRERAAAARQTAMERKASHSLQNAVEGPAGAHGDQRSGRRQPAGGRLALRRRGGGGAGRRGPAP